MLSARWFTKTKITIALIMVSGLVMVGALTRSAQAHLIARTKYLVAAGTAQARLALVPGPDRRLAVMVNRLDYELKQAALFIRSGDSQFAKRALERYKSQAQKLTTLLGQRFDRREVLTRSQIDRLTLRLDYQQAYLAQLKILAPSKNDGPIALAIQGLQQLSATVADFRGGEILPAVADLIRLTYAGIIDSHTLTETFSMSSRQQVFNQLKERVNQGNLAPGLLTILFNEPLINMNQKVQKQKVGFVLFDELLRIAGRLVDQADKASDPGDQGLANYLATYSPNGRVIPDEYSIVSDYLAGLLLYMPLALLTIPSLETNELPIGYRPLHKALLETPTDSQPINLQNFWLQPVETMRPIYHRWLILAAQTVIERRIAGENTCLTIASSGDAPGDQVKRSINRWLELFDRLSLKDVDQATFRSFAESKWRELVIGQTPLQLQSRLENRLRYEAQQSGVAPAPAESSGPIGFPGDASDNSNMSLQEKVNFWEESSTFSQFIPQFNPGVTPLPFSESAPRPTANGLMPNISTPTPTDERPTPSPTLSVTPTPQSTPSPSPTSEPSMPTPSSSVAPSPSSTQSPTATPTDGPTVPSSATPSPDTPPATSTQPTLTPTSNPSNDFTPQVLTPISRFSPFVAKADCL